MTGSKPFWAKCTACGHVWPAAYLPMELSQCAKLLMKTHCPKCAGGPKGITIAKQDDGELLEPGSDNPRDIPGLPDETFHSKQEARS